MIETTEHPYIVKNDEILGGEPIIAGTRTPVRAIVENWRMGMRPDEIPLRLPQRSRTAYSIKLVPAHGRSAFEEPIRLELLARTIAARLCAMPHRSRTSAASGGGARRGRDESRPYG